MNTEETIRITIVGAGFAGITAAQRLAELHPDVAIRIINPRPFFQYYPAMYRVVTGSSPLAATIPLMEIFSRHPSVEIINDTITNIDPAQKSVTGSEGVTYTSDYLLLAVGSQNTYFNIEGVAELSFNFKSIHEAMRLRARVKQMFAECSHMEHEEKLLALHFVIVGGGPSGVELAGEMATYTRRLARKYGVPGSYITIDLVEAAPRILPALDPKVSEKATHHLRSIGVNVYANRMVVKSESWTVIMKDMKVGARTLIWTAGVKAHELYSSIEEFSYDGKGRVVVDEYMQAKDFNNIYIAGDNASTQYSGLAQTAIYDGEYIADTISDSIQQKSAKQYKPKPVSFDIPVGPGWGILIHRGWHIYGWVAWIVRHVIDLKFFISILPLGQALRYFFNKEEISDTGYGSRKEN